MQLLSGLQYPNYKKNLPLHSNYKKYYNEPL